MIRPGRTGTRREADERVRRTEFLNEVDRIRKQGCAGPDAGRVRTNFEKIVRAVVIDPCGNQGAAIQRKPGLFSRATEFTLPPTLMPTWLSLLPSIPPLFQLSNSMPILLLSPS